MLGMAMWLDLYKWVMERFFGRSPQQRAFAAQPAASPPVSKPAEDNLKDGFGAHPGFG